MDSALDKNSVLFKLRVSQLRLKSQIEDQKKVIKTLSYANLSILTGAIPGVKKFKLVGISKLFSVLSGPILLLDEVATDQLDTAQKTKKIVDRLIHEEQDYRELLQKKKLAEAAKEDKWTRDIQKELYEKHTNRIIRDSKHEVKDFDKVPMPGNEDKVASTA